MPLRLEELRAATPPDYTKPYTPAGPDRTQPDGPTPTPAEPPNQTTPDSSTPVGETAGSFESSTRPRAYARTGCETPHPTKADLLSAEAPRARNVRPVLPDALAWCLNQHETHQGPFPAAGGRNAWVAALAYFCNERGVPLADLEGHAEGYQQPDFPPDEIRRTVRGIYQREAARHNSKPWEPPRTRAGGAGPDFISDDATGQPGSRSAEAGAAAEAQPLDTPTIPAEAYALLPGFLQRCCQPLPTARERDVLLTGALAVLSGCFPTLEGAYRGKVIGANVYAFIVAPAASGKGALDWARRLAWPYHLAVREASRRERDAYELALQDYEQLKRAAKAGAPLPPKPAEPPRRRLFIPVDNGAANVVKTLAENDERGILFDTEADTLSGALKQDFGDYSALLRKCSEHEPHQYDRKTAGTYELSRPALSVALGGTPEQVARLIPSAEDGLFSRFWFYAFQAPHQWDDPFAEPSGGTLDTWFEDLSVQVSGMIAAAGAGRVAVVLTPPQVTRFNAAWNAWLRQGVADFGEGSGSAVKRHARACFRLCMLLTLLRCFEDGEAPAGRTLACEDADLTAALLLADVYRQHALALYERLPRAAGAGFGTATKYAAKAGQEALARELQAQGLSVRDIAEQVGVHFTTVARWLRCKV